MENKQVTTGKQYPFPTIPPGWSRDEVQFAQGIRAVFDILFSRKIKDVLLADGSVTSRVIAKKSVALSHLVDGFGTDLDISDNLALQGVRDQICPVGSVILADAVPAFGSWTEVDIGVTGIKAWKRVS